MFGCDASRVVLMRWQGTKKDEDGFMSGVDIRPTLLKSGLDTKSLGSIWMEIDEERKGKVRPRRRRAPGSRLQIDREQLHMVLALISNYQQNKQVSLEDIDFDAVPPPKLQGIELPMFAGRRFRARAHVAGQGQASDDDDADRVRQQCGGGAVEQRQARPRHVLALALVLLGRLRTHGQAEHSLLLCVADAERRRGGQLEAVEAFLGDARARLRVKFDKGNVVAVGHEADLARVRLAAARMRAHLLEALVLAEQHLQHGLGGLLRQVAGKQNAVRQLCGASGANTCAQRPTARRIGNVLGICHRSTAGRSRCAGFRLALGGPCAAAERAPLQPAPHLSSPCLWCTCRPPWQ